MSLDRSSFSGDRLQRSLAAYFSDNSMSGVDPRRREILSLLVGSFFRTNPNLNENNYEEPLEEFLQYVDAIYAVTRDVILNPAYYLEYERQDQIDLLAKHIRLFKKIYDLLEVSGASSNLVDAQLQPNVHIEQNDILFADFLKNICQNHKKLMQLVELQVDNIQTILASQSYDQAFFAELKSFIKLNAPFFLKSDENLRLIELFLLYPSETCYLIKMQFDLSALKVFKQNNCAVFFSKRMFSTLHKEMQDNPEFGEVIKNIFENTKSDQQAIRAVQLVTIHKDFTKSMLKLGFDFRQLMELSDENLEFLGVNHYHFGNLPPLPQLKKEEIKKLSLEAAVENRKNSFGEAFPVSLDNNLRLVLAIVHYRLHHPQRALPFYSRSELITKSIIRSLGLRPAGLLADSPILPLVATASAVMPLNTQVVADIIYAMENHHAAIAQIHQDGDGSEVQLEWINLLKHVHHVLGLSRVKEWINSSQNRLERVDALALELRFELAYSDFGTAYSIEDVENTAELLAKFISRHTAIAAVAQPAAASNSALVELVESPSTHSAEESAVVPVSSSAPPVEMGGTTASTDAETPSSSSPR